MITRHMGSYDHELFNAYLDDNQDIIEEDILGELRHCNINRALIKLDSYMQEAHKISKIKTPKATELPRMQMEKANSAFESYQDSLEDNSAKSPEGAYQEYQHARNGITGEMHKSEFEKWDHLVKSESKTLWENIDWKGNLSKDVGNDPRMTSLRSTLRNCTPVMTLPKQLTSSNFKPITTYLNLMTLSPKARLTAR